MNTYTAILSVCYHSGQTPLPIQVQSNSVYAAKLMLETQYGQGTVLSVPTIVY